MAEISFALSSVREQSAAPLAPRHCCTQQARDSWPEHQRQAQHLLCKALEMRGVENLPWEPELLPEPFAKVLFVVPTDADVVGLPGRADGLRKVR
jgi:hypothetical protein